MFNLNDCKRYRRTVGSIAGSCLTTAIPLLASEKQAACLVVLDIVEVLFLAVLFQYFVLFSAYPEEIQDKRIQNKMRCQ